MKRIIFLSGVALLCGGAFAQQEPPGGKPAARAQMRVEAKTGTAGTAMEPAAAGTTGAMGMGMGMGMDMKGMDTNGDGMISKKEWEAYHGKMWGRMKLKNGVVSITDLQAQMKGGPN